MNYLTVFLVGMIIGLLVNVFLSFYSSKRTISIPKEKPWATKDDVLKITHELEKLKNISKINYASSSDEVKNNDAEEIEIPETDENSDAEKEFYESIRGEN